MDASEPKAKPPIASTGAKAPAKIASAPAPVATLPAKPAPARRGRPRKVVESKPVESKAAEPVTKPVPAPRKATAVPPQIPAKAVAAEAPLKTPIVNTFSPKGDFQMATAPKTENFTADLTNNFKAFADGVEERAKAAAKTAYDKGSEAAKTAYSKSTEFVEGSSEMTRKNAEAVAASGKIFTNRLKDLGEDLIDDSRAALSTIGDDFKKFAELKSPAEVFKFQAEVVSRNFEALTSFGSKTGNSIRGLAQESFEPLAARAKSNYDMFKGGF